jgi:hypothetical protein
MEWIRQHEKTTWYNAYLKTDWWQYVRRRCMERSYRACECCEGIPNRAYEVHHLTYDRLGAELPTDVVAVCRACHAKFHNRPPPNDEEHGRYGWQGMPEIIYRILERQIRLLGKKAEQEPRT